MCKISSGFQLPARRLLGFVALLALAGLCGCGGSDPFPYVKVKGTITYDDGSLIPADRIELRFISQAPRSIRRPIRGKASPTLIRRPVPSR